VGGQVLPIDVKLRERREAVLRELLAAQGRHDADASISCFEHARYELVGNAHVYEGPDEVARYYRETWATFPDFALDLIELHHAENAVWAEFWMTGTHLGDRPGFEPTGKRFRCRGAAIFAFGGDALTGARIYYDTGTIARQLAT
jgi:predicted ester cyclase